MKKLGLDIGSSSIGWALRDENNCFTNGVITFKSGMVKGQTGGYTSPTKDRREARSKRKLIQARKYRKWELLKMLLNEFVPLDKTELENWSKYKKGQIQKFPENPNFLKWLKCDFSYINIETKYNNPYELRVIASENKLSKHEFGRALYHLVQRRGYKNIGESDTEEFDAELASKDSETKTQLERREKEGFKKALDKYGTIAKALQKEFLDKGIRARNQYPLRREYKHELEQICKAQGYDISTNDKGEYNDTFIQKLWKAIIWQRPLKSQKGNIGKCTLESNKPRCPISHPIFEIFRTWSFINTIKYYNEDGDKQSLLEQERNSLFEFFLKKDKTFKFEEIKNFLDKQLKSKKKYNYPIDKEEKYDTSVSGMPVCKGFIDVFGETVKNALTTIHLNSIDNAEKIIKNKYSVYDLWHILFAFDERTATDKKFLEKFATEKLNIGNQTTKKGDSFNPFEKLKDNFDSGYADLSVKAMCKIIPFLKAGYLYNEAVALAKVPELLGRDWETQKKNILKTIRESNEIYNYQKTITSITNNLIDHYKGLPTTETFAFKDYAYNLDGNDLKDVENACKGHFGEKSWNEKSDTKKNELLDAVKKQYQDFFSDSKRSYRTTPLLTNIFKERLKEIKIELKGDLYHHSNIENKYGEPIVIMKGDREVTILPEARIDSIKNPMFNKSMSILRKLINQLIIEEKIDNETEIVIELARELNDNNKRAAIERYQNERKNNRQKYREFLQEFNQKENRNINVEESLSTFELWTEQIFDETITKDEKQKEKRENNNSLILKEKEAVKRYELWTEQKGQCMYTGKMISISQLFSNEIDIEHTIPRSILPDNTMANQTVAFASYNRDKKKNQFPTQCNNYNQDVQSWGTAIAPRLDNWIAKRDHCKKLYENNQKPKGNEDEIKKNKRVQDKHYFKMHYDYWNDKVERFTAEEVKDSWARRQLVDTQMTSKYAREFLKTYFNKVSVQKGSTTADFRKIYGFQEEDEIKSRDQHTHHTVDATVLTLIPVNSSYRDKILKKYYEEDENGQPITNRKPFEEFNSQSLIRNIEQNTLIVNYENDKILKQTTKNVRKRGMLQFLKDKQGKFVLDENGNKIPLVTQGDTVRSELFAQTYLGKIKDVERDDFEKEFVFNNLKIKAKGFPKKREHNNWIYKQGKEEFIFVKREPIDKVKSSDKLIDDIVDPIIRELVRKQKKDDSIIDYQGNVIRHVRIKTSAGKEVKDRVNYTSKHDYKNKFYSQAGSIPYAILLQKSNGRKIERVMIPIASFELAKAYKNHGSFIIDEYLKKYDEENQTSLSSYSDKKLLKVGQKVLVLQDDKDFEQRNNIDFHKNRLYRITQFKYDGSKIMLQYHLEAQAKSEIDNQVKLKKDNILWEQEKELSISKITENATITDTKARKVDYEKRLYDFTSRLKLIEQSSDKQTADELKKEIELYKTESSKIEIEGQTPILGLSKNNWNFLYEGEDFEVSITGKLTFY